MQCKSHGGRAARKHWRCSFCGGNGRSRLDILCEGSGCRTTTGMQGRRETPAVVLIAEKRCGGNFRERCRDGKTYTENARDGWMSVCTQYNLISVPCNRLTSERGIVFRATICRFVPTSVNRRSWGWGLSKKPSYNTPYIIFMYKLLVIYEHTKDARPICT